MDNSIVARIQKHDPKFNEYDFCSWCQDVLKELQKAWSEKDLETLEKYETKELFLIHQKQLQNMEELQVQNIVKDIKIENAKVTHFECTQGKDYIEVHFQLSLIDYYMSLETQKVLKGNTTLSKYIQYKLVFMKDERIASEGFDFMGEDVCPYCGAPIDLSETTYCVYCQRNIHVKTTVYRVCELEIVS